MPYVDLNTIHDPATGTVAPAAWGDQIRDNFEFLIDPPACSAFHSTTQSVANNTHQILNANSENFDNDGMHNTVTNNARITIQTPGRYLVGAIVEYGAFTGTTLRVWTSVLVNAVQFDLDIRPNVNSGTTVNRVNVSRTLLLAQGDVVVVQANQNSGGSLPVQLYEFYALYQTR